MRTITINDQILPFRGAASVRFGSGEDSTVVQFEAFLAESGGLFFLHKDDKVYRLYHRMADPVPAPVKVYETVSGSNFKGYLEFTVDSKNPVFRWGRQAEPAPPEAGPCAGSYDSLQISDGKGGDFVSFYNVTLVSLGPDRFASATLPASKLPREKVERSGFPLDGYSLAFLGFGGYLFYLATRGESGALTTIWWFCGLLGLFKGHSARHSWGYLAAHLLGATFFIHFLTYGLDFEFALRHSQEMAVRQEVIKLGAILSGLLCLRVAKKKFYSLVADSALQAGVFCFWFWVIAVFIYSAVDEYNHYPYFAEYAGSLPWSLLWPCAWLLAWQHIAQDYSRVPMGFRSFAALLHRLTQALRGSLEDIRDSRASLERWADDLEDSLRLTEDPRLRPWSAYGVYFKQTQAMLGQMEHLECPVLQEDRVRLGLDLECLASDLEEFARMLGGEEIEVLSPRLSPYLRSLEA